MAGSFMGKGSRHSPYWMFVKTEQNSDLVKYCKEGEPGCSYPV